MDSRKWRLPFVLLLTLISINIFSRQSDLVERYYSRGIYPIIANVLSSVSSIFPFALGEMLILVGTLGLFVFVLHFFFKNRRKRSMIFIGSQKRGSIIPKIVSLVLIVLVSFQLLWGLNYSRLPMKTVLGLDVRPRASAELYEVMVWHIERANEIRLGLESSDFDQTYNVWSGYEALTDDYKALATVKGKAKKLVSSTFFSYAGIAGIYNPFLGEPNINGLQVDYMHPVVQAHELAHLQGVAREDEANFAAVISCLSHEEDFVNYSGHMLAIIHMSNALYRSDKDLWMMANERISIDVREDLDRNNKFWESYEGWFEEASSDLNDAYLKANGQADGVKSYGRMIDLLLATFDQYKEM